MLPPFYIGSSSLKKIQSGYCGSVTSKKYKNIFIREIKYNRHLFKTKIISLHDTRQEALIKENILQRKLDVVKSSMYFNESFASENGFFGHDNSGINNGMFGKTHSQETIAKLKKPKSSKVNYFKPKSEIHKKNISKYNAMKNPENRKKVGQSKVGRKGLFKDGKRKMIFPGSDMWFKLISEGYSPKL